MRHPDTRLPSGCHSVSILRDMNKVIEFNSYFYHAIEAIDKALGQIREFPFSQPLYLVIQVGGHYCSDAKKNRG